jgi:NADPH:quinone reductase-like Zn-dependent oxidoreductase
MNSSSLSYRLAPSGATHTLHRHQSAPGRPGPGQVLIRIAAASLNYRDLLTLQDTAGNREGLVPLSDGAGTVLAVGAGVTRWREGARVSPGFFPAWRDGAFSPAVLAQH